MVRIETRNSTPRINYVDVGVTLTPSTDPALLVAIRDGANQERELLLSGAELCDTDIAQLIDAIKNSKGLAMLDLSENPDVTDAGGVALLMAIGGGALPCLVDLRLHGCGTAAATRSIAATGLKVMRQDLVVHFEKRIARPAVERA